MTELQTFASLLKQQIADLHKSVVADMKRAVDGGLVSENFLASGLFHMIAENTGRLKQLEEALSRLPEDCSAIRSRCEPLPAK
jgi:hypothetical protein